MKLRYKLISGVISVFIAGGFLVIASRLMQKEPIEKIHILQAPMSIVSEKDESYDLLPK
jgi:hypothetical protein